MNPAPPDLQRFITAQDPVYSEVLAELRAGRKRTHWMWFVFPQFAGLGHSTMAQRYAIQSREEACAFLRDATLGERLRQCTRLILALDNRPIEAILGPPDDTKFRSCMTLFDGVAPEEPLFQRALDRYFAGQADPRTLALLAAA
jgi:uncharacterized protein (DUF1810 family)